MIKRLLIIPARVGSKRIKNKNFKKFNGKPIIFYSIESALKSNIFCEIHVSTDNKKINTILKKYPIDTKFLRPKSLSGDNIGLMKVFKYVVKKYETLGKTFDEIWYLTPCSPLIKSSNLKSASNFFKKKNIKCLLAVSKFSPPTQWALKINNQGKLLPIYEKKLNTKSQNLEKRFYDTGTFGAFKSNVFKKKNNISYNGYYIPRFQGIDIDTMEDWKLAEKIFKAEKK